MHWVGADETDGVFGGRAGKAPIIRNVFFECCICGTMGLISMAVWANLIADLNRANILSDLYDFRSGSSFGLVLWAECG